MLFAPTIAMPASLPMRRLNNPNLSRFHAHGSIEHYEHPAGYKPDAEALKDGVHISDIKPGTRFIASDGQEYRAHKLVISRCFGGLKECDLYAYRDGTFYIFHAPVYADPLMVTFLKTEK